tara:strand:+ start:16 stop:516 length:501 start_codon:yes stop_codon:yes gene_type:complete
MANPMYGQNKADNALDKVGSEVIVAVADKTLAASDSGATVFVNAAAISVTLPAAKAGLNFKIILGIDTTAGADLLCTAGDAFFGIVRLFSDTADQVGVPQQISHATAIGTVANYDTMDFVADTATLGGMAGDVIQVVAVDDTAWHVSADLTTTQNDPGTVAVIKAS